MVRVVGLRLFSIRAVLKAKERPLGKFVVQN
jgi:hypothetical protein